MPALQRQLLEQAIESRSDCTLMKDTRPAIEMLLKPTESPDVVVVGLGTPADAPIASAILARWPAAQVMTVTAAGNDACIYQLRPHQRVIGEASPAEIVEMLHSSVCGDRGRTGR
jgi:hypothetical protein